eukprot:CAMPEP_0176489718 /NCGR_PEP_ID=MMETSP0200_2-20121128/7456_1 /TAXON_ID=947934 /ORGANISM="Chaetoceros sp., Strain GSL56" /LENGTH=521 /DNA_ID=CAMNT_0017886915 /DNA_START=130 /DNA_END=1695 /DNA_ORIENTATION=+
MSFPLKMMTLLNEGHQYSDIISWLPHGRGFTILDKKRFETEVMPKYFQDSKYTSFTRRLRRWNFRIQTHGHKRSSYFHPSFVKGRDDLCREMKALPQVRKRRGAGGGSSSSSAAGLASSHGVSHSFPPLLRGHQGQEYTNAIHFAVMTGATAATTETGATTTNGKRSMKGPLKKRISTIVTTSPSRLNDSDEIHAVVSTNGSCDSTSSIGESVDSSSSRGGEGGARSEKQGAPASSSLAMPPLAQPIISPTTGGNRNNMTPGNHTFHPNMEKLATVATSAGMTIGTSASATDVNTGFCYPPTNNNNNGGAVGNYAVGSTSLPQSLNMLGGMPNPYCQQPQFVTQPHHPLHLQQQQQQQQQVQQQQQQQMMAYCNNSVARFHAPPASSYSTNPAMMPSLHFSDHQHSSSSWGGPVSQFSFTNNMMNSPSAAPVAPVPNMPNNNNSMCYPMECFNSQPPMGGYHPGVVPTPTNNNGGRGPINMMQHHAAGNVHQAAQFFHNQNFNQHSNMMTPNMISNYNGMM